MTSVNTELENLPFFEHLTASQQEFLRHNSMIRTFPKGSCLHGNDEQCLGVVLVKSGMLRTYMLSDDGREITLYRLYGGDMCVLSASCILESITFDVFIDADEDSEVVIINAASFNKLKEENIYVEAFVYKTATERFSDVMWAMQQILFMRADQRLAVFLLDETSKTGSDKVNMTHEQVAKYMGSAREVVSRLLKYFSNEGIVELSRGGIRIIDRKKLQSFI